MKRSPADININLVPQDPFYESPLGKFLQWALSAGRYIVIFTELVVIISFATRFTLDRQITDLNVEILQKEELVKSFGDLEDNFKHVQNRLEQYKQVSQEENITEIFPQLTAITPNDVLFERLIISPDKVDITGRALSQGSFNTLITNMQLSETFMNVSVSKVSSEDNTKPGFSFQISARTKELPTTVRQAQPPSPASSTVPEAEL